MRTTWLLLIAVVPALACSSNRLAGAKPELHVAPSTQGFGDVFLHTQAERTLELRNSGGAADTVQLTLRGDASYSVPTATVRVGAGDSVSLALVFAPTEAGSPSAVAHLEWSNGSADVALSGQGLAWPECPPVDPCHRTAFAPDAGTCELTSRPDGTTCHAGGGCLVNSVCVAGQCRGDLLDCTDGDRCTADACAPDHGCQHSPAHCASADPCQVPSCDPALGCVTTPALDGTSCGASVGCKAAGVCVSGSCVQARVPDGTACSLDWAPCATDASCRAGECVSPTAAQWTPGQVLWRHAMDGGIGDWSELHAVDDAGNSYLSQWDPQQLVSLDLCGHERWRQPMLGFVHGAMLSGAQLFVEPSGVLERRDSSTGLMQWQFDVAQALGHCPDGGLCGSSIQGDLYAGPIVLSNAGQLFVSGSSHGPPWSLRLMAVSTAGRLDWVSSVGSISAVVGGANQVADTSGNLYLYLLGQTAATLRSYDHAGALRFQVGSYAQQNLAVGPDFVLDLGGNPSTAWTSLGNTLFTIPTHAPNLNGSGVIDEQGVTTFWTGTVAPGGPVLSSPGLVRVDARGQVLAAIAIQGTDLSELTLDEAGRANLVGTTNASPQHHHLWCWDGVSSRLDLDVDLGAPPAVRSSPGTNLFISHGLALLELGGVVQAIFVGHHGEATRAPWRRGVGGTNENRHSP